MLLELSCLRKGTPVSQDARLVVPLLICAASALRTAGKLVVSLQRGSRTAAFREQMDGAHVTSVR